VADDEPVSVPPARATPASDFKLPRAPERVDLGKWVPSDQYFTVKDLTIGGGMVYVGTSLKTPSGGNDPCLIDLTKPIARQGDYTQGQMGYWPSYSEISPTARRAYLNWLAGGRRDPEADIGYVFLFFYGLERREFIDAAKDEAAQRDRSEIAVELRRLLEVYGEKSNSFRSYASHFLEWISLSSLPSRLYEKPVPEFKKSFELPIYIRLALGQAAKDRVPVPANLALAWAKLDQNVSLRTPVRRCAEEFDKLFELKYAELCGSGMVLPRNRTKLKFAYHPASAGFRGYSDLKLTFQDTPDVSVLSAPQKKLQEVVEAATQPLEAFSRLMGKNPSSKTTLEGLLLLPTSLWPDGPRGALQTLKTRIEEGMVTMQLQDLLNIFGPATAVTKALILSLAHTLESVNIGVEPDVLCGAKPPKAEGRVVLFQLSTSERLSPPDKTYVAASLTLQLASAVATADGEFGDKEMKHLRDAVLSWGHLTPSQISRLFAHLNLLKEEPVSLTGLKKRFELLDKVTKEKIAAFVATVAQSDGGVSAAEVIMLEKVYKALGVNTTRVFSDVHEAAAGTKQTVPDANKDKDTYFSLDLARIATLQEDTEKLSTLLADIYNEVDEQQEDAQAEPVEPEAEGESDTIEAPKSLLGLDLAHTTLARTMLSRTEWNRDELLDLTADLDLMLDGALEQINEAAFDTYDIPFFEGDEPVVVNADLLDKLAE
jgi:uncharacterized tellurite resistance protein B-like protein